ncbi:MAG: pyridoxal phosphate-dependent aminotransferase [Pseudomonadota bacterium]|jgi:aspartate aminotransferase
MKNLPLSSRAEKTPPSPIRKLAGLAQRAEERGKRVYRLNIGQPDLLSPPEFLEQVAANLKPVVSYEASRGAPELLEAWCDYINRDYSLGLTPQRMLITSGASEALIFSFMVCCDPGDEILIFDPTYANYIGFAAISGVRLVPVPCAPKSSTALPSRAEIESFISPYTRAILICNPNNPTGSVCSDAELRSLLDICRERDLYLIADETYREFVFGDTKPRCVLELAKEDPRIIVVDSLSKRFSLCGARIGCLITWHEGLMQAAFHIAQARLAAATIEQAAAARMLRTISSEYLESAREEYAKRRDVAVEALAALPGVVAYPPKGGFYLLADLPVDDAEDFASFMLTDFDHQGDTTFVAPAAGFYMRRESGRRAIRVAFVLNQTDTRRAIEVLGYGLIEYAKRQAIKCD